MAQTLKTLRTKRNLQPAHYLLRVNSYSLMCSSAIDVYESSVFEAGGNKWRLVLHPEGDSENNGENHVSLYLAMAETDALADGWEVNAIFTLFVYDQLEDKYVAVQDVTGGGVKRFHAMKTTWGFSQLLPLETFKDPSKGYLVDDSCVFGAEVLVINRTGKNEALSLLKSRNINDATFISKFEKFSECKDSKWQSEAFTFGEKKWTVLLYPNGENIYENKSLGLYLMPGNWNYKYSIYVDAKLRLRDQLNDNHVELKVRRWFSSKRGWGDEDLISLEELHDPSRGFIVRDCLIVEVEFVVVSEISSVQGENQ